MEELALTHLLEFPLAIVCLMEYKSPYISTGVTPHNLREFARIQLKYDNNQLLDLDKILNNVNELLDSNTAHISWVRFVKYMQG